MSENDGFGVSPAERDPDETRQLVRERYAGVATAAEGDGGGCCDNDGCCGDGAVGSEQVGYGAEELAAVENGADLGLGCGNPKTIAELAPGETVLDLGSGAGFDCFLVAREVGEEGRVIGVDMTPEMVSKARENASKNDASNVEFRLGEIEHLPVADASVDVVSSNCVVNLSPEKQRVFDEAFRMLRPGGRLAISDVVRTAPFPPDVHTDPEPLAACVAGASTVDALESMLADAGFGSVGIAPKDESDEFIGEWDDGRDLSEYLVSAAIEAVKPVDDAAYPRPGRQVKAGACPRPRSRAPSSPFDRRRHDVPVPAPVCALEAPGRKPALARRDGAWE